MSANELRQAAETLRERVGVLDAAEGDEGTASWSETFASPDQNGYVNTDHLYIATMHPGVGLALADWLDDAAKWEATPATVNHDMRAHDIARLINEGAS